jgi:hypothetical protein
MTAKATVAQIWKTTGVVDHKKWKEELDALLTKRGISLHSLTSTTTWDGYDVPSVLVTGSLVLDAAHGQDHGGDIDIVCFYKNYYSVARHLADMFFGTAKDDPAQYIKDQREHWNVYDIFGSHVADVLAVDDPKEAIQNFDFSFSRVYYDPSTKTFVVQNPSDTFNRVDNEGNATEERILKYISRGYTICRLGSGLSEHTTTADFNGIKNKRIMAVIRSKDWRLLAIRRVYDLKEQIRSMEVFMKVQEYSSDSWGYNNALAEMRYELFSILTDCSAYLTFADMAEQVQSRDITVRKKEELEKGIRMYWQNADDRYRKMKGWGAVNSFCGIVYDGQRFMGLV